MGKPHDNKLHAALAAARNLVEVLEAQKEATADAYNLDKDAIRTATEKAAHASQRLTDYSW